MRTFFQRYTLRTAGVLLLAATAFAGCRYRYVDKPERLLSPQEMTEVICRLAYLDALERQGAFERDSVYRSIGKDAFLLKLYEDFDIDKQTLQRNNEYYMERYKDYTKIYSDALERINALIGELEKNEKKRQDELIQQTGWGAYE